jgi:hypothetical protein
MSPLAYILFLDENHKKNPLHIILKNKIKTPKKTTTEANPETSHSTKKAEK